MQEFDFFVIGGGSGGVRAARIAAGHGARVGLAERDRMGGTCVIRGCVPKKLFVHAAKFAQDFRDATGFGWAAGTPRFDWSRFKTVRDREIARLESVYREGLAAAGVTVFEGAARFVDARTLQIVPPGGGAPVQIRARAILIATGGEPAISPSIAGYEHALSSNDMFDLEQRPDTIIINGGGYIAVEFAGIMHGLGARTHLLYRGEKILRGFDDDVRDALQQAMLGRGIDIRCHTRITQIERENGALRVHTDKGETLAGDALLMAIGRRPCTAGLDPGAAGVACDSSGAVVVDDLSHTKAPGVYAVGDVTNRVNLTPVAIREGHMLADRLFGGGTDAVDHESIPSAVFSQPEIGTVGLTEAQAAAQFPAIDIYMTCFRPLYANLAGHGDDEKTVMKLVVNAADSRVLGVHLLGPASAEMIQLAGVAIKTGSCKADFDRTLAVHPTSAEELVTLRSPVRKIRAPAP